MEPRRRLLLQLAVATIAGLPSSPAGWAQSYPARPVRVIVPFAPGGATDVIARLITQKLSEHVGQPFYVENIPGASGNIGTSQAARAAADGYTLLFAFSSYVTSPSLSDKLPYDADKDFDPITLAVVSPAVVFVNPAVPAKSIEELIGLITTSPGKYSFASGGTGTQPHLAGEQFRLALRLDLVHVPYNGGGPAITSVVAGHTPVGFTTLAPAMPQIKAGKLRALAITSKRRWQTLPDVPTMTEAGYPDIEGDTWVGVLVPAGAPAEVISLVNREVVRIVTLPETRERLAVLGFEPVGNKPHEFAAQIRLETAKWAKVIRAAGVKGQ
jgi:tripartite-type tricarboxylate transporter receptor subunit TctC